MEGTTWETGVTAVTTKILSYFNPILANRGADDDQRIGFVTPKKTPWLHPCGLKEGLESAALPIGYEPLYAACNRC